jgi:hypothetical protein
MAKIVRPKTAGRTVTVTVEKRRGGREVFRVATGGDFRTLTTSRASIAAMDRAMVKYGRALRRLADR